MRVALLSGLVALGLLVGTGACATANRAESRTPTAEGRDVALVDARVVPRLDNKIETKDYLFFTAFDPNSKEKFDIVFGPDEKDTYGSAIWRGTTGWELQSGFVYFCGWRPFGRTTRVRIGADGTTMAVQMVPPNKERVYFFSRDSGNSTETVKIFDNKNTTGNVNAEVKNPGNFIEITDKGSAGLDYSAEAPIAGNPDAEAFRKYLEGILKQAGVLMP